MCDDGTMIAMWKCKSCDASMWKCTTCGTMKNTCEDSKSATMHERFHHNVTSNPTLSINTIDKNTIE